MSKRDPQDYDLNDVRTYVAEVNGYTLPQIVHLDFPGPDYLGDDGAPYWRMETISTWLNSLHAAMIATQRAQHPEPFEEFARIVTAIMRGQQ